MARQRGSAASIPNDKVNALSVKHKYYRERKVIKAITISSSVLIMCLSIFFINIFPYVESTNERTDYIEDKILDYCFKDKKPIAIEKIIGSSGPIYCSNSVTPFSNEDVYKIMRKISWEKYGCFQNFVIYSSFSDDV